MTSRLEPDAEPAWCDRVRRGLRAWYAGGHRDLPWRRDRDPYRVLVSEMMLVQTTVAAVIPYFERFLAQFPTVEALANADEAEVLKAWEGLGYYRRARQLHAAAKVIAGQHAGLVPDDLEALLALPGIGRYIAGAVLSFAFDRPAPIVEANTQRVLARLLAWTEDLAKPQTQKRLWTAADRLVPEVEPGEFNQAFMELGATVCTVREPRCLVCPIAAECLARAEGIQDSLPIKTPKPPPLEGIEATAIVRRSGCLLMVQRGPSRLWEGFWEFPTIHIAGSDPAGRSFGDAIDLGEGVRRLTGVNIAAGEAEHTIKFGVTKHRITLNVHQASDLGGEVVPAVDFKAASFVKPDDVSGLTMGSAMRRVARWANDR